MHIQLEESLTLSYEDFMKMTYEQKVAVNSAIFKINDVIADLNDEDSTLHIHNVPSDLVPEINRYNRHHHGPNGNQINITDICVKALKAALEQRLVVWDEPAAELPDNPEDIDGKELNPGDRVSFKIVGPDANNSFEGIVTLEGETYCVQSGDNLFILDDDLLEIKLLEWNESSSPECSVCDEVPQ